MNDEVARRAHALLRQAIELDAGERRVFLESACQDDSVLRRRVSDLISAVEASESFLSKPASDLSGNHAEELIPEQIGNYRIVRRIGSGGMATVFEAIQSDPERRMALKLPRYAWLDDTAMQRFRYETQILARLQHPNIAHVYEAGLWKPADGLATPFFAMEFIADARSIADFHPNE